MKKNVLKMICILSGLIILSGCGSKAGNAKTAGQSSDSGKAAAAEAAPAETAAGKDTEMETKAAAETVTETNKDPLEDTGNRPEQAAQEKPASDGAENNTDGGFFAEAFAKGLVDNNGSYFVTVGNRVYFRLISPDSMEEGATFGEFLHTEWTPVECPLICYDLDTCEWEEAGKITGAGKLYACPEGFYIGELNPGSLDSYCTELYDPAAGKSEVYCRGIPLGVSDSGKLLAVEQHGGQNITMALIRDGKETASFGGENIFYEYCGFAGEDLIVMLHTAEDEFVLCSADSDGKVTELGSVGRTAYSYPEFKQLAARGDEVYLTFGYYEGTGHFLSEWKTVRAVPGKEASLGEVTDGRDDYDTAKGEGPENEVPLMCFDTGGALFYSPHLPYEAYMGTGEHSCDLYCYDDSFEECLLVKDFIRNDHRESCQIVQDITSAYDTVFAMYADAVEDSEYEIGWRTGYRRTGWHTCAVPYGYGHADKDGLAKEIIYFDGTDPGREVSGSLSGDELKSIENKLNSIGYYGFLRSTYSDPTGISWEEVFYVGAGLDRDHGDPPENVKDAYLRATGEEELFTDLTTLSGRDIMDYVKKTTGLDYAEMKYPLGWIYLEEFDLYANEHGDTNWSQVQVTAGQYENGRYTVTYTGYKGAGHCVTFEEQDGEYRFISNLPE